MAMTIDTTPSDKPYLSLGAGITRIDTGFFRKGMAACYLMERTNEQGIVEIAIVETGIAKTVPLLLQLIADKGYSVEQVKYVIPTHVHLDHAGGVGGLMSALPQATLVIHPQGARHMIDPSKLQAGAIAVYGEAVFNETYGVLVPVPEARVQVAPDGFTLPLGQSTLTFYDTPGHARHHFCVLDSLSNGVFTGDTCGIAYPELNVNGVPFLFPTTTPVQFDPQAMKESIGRLLALNPDYFYLTHYGAIAVTPDLQVALYEQIDVLVQIAEAHPDASERHDALCEALMVNMLTRYREQGGRLSEAQARAFLDADVGLNAQGLAVWLERKNSTR